MKLNVSTKVKQKLAEKHSVQIEEVEQCFCNREKGCLIDTREDHKTDPPTQWFIAENDYGKKLKVVFIQEKNGSISLKSAFIPNSQELAIYKRHAK